MNIAFARGTSTPARRKLRPFCLCCMVALECTLGALEHKNSTTLACKPSSHPALRAYSCRRSIPPENPPRVEYVVELAQAPHLFVIRKQQRKEAAAQPVVLAYYYVLDKMVYQVRARCVYCGLGGLISGVTGDHNTYVVASKRRYWLARYCYCKSARASRPKRLSFLQNTHHCHRMLLSGANASCCSVYKSSPLPVEPSRGLP